MGWRVYRRRRLGVLTPSGDGRHGQGVLLIDGIQLLCAHGVDDELELLTERLTAVRHADVRDVGATYVVALGTFLSVVGAQPVAFCLKGGRKPDE